MGYRREIVSVSKTVPPSLREYLFPLGGQLRDMERVTDEEAGDFNTITLPLIHMRGPLNRPAISFQRLRRKLVLKP